jgi:hypothetical protein
MCSRPKGLVVRSSSRPLAALLAAVLLLTACSGDDDTGSTIGDGQSETPDGTQDSQGATANESEDEDEDEQEPDPTVIPEDPDDIDEAYAQAVIDEIDGYYHQALRIARQGAPLPDGAPPVELVVAVEETFRPEWRDAILQDEIETFSEPQWSEENEERFRPADEYRPGAAQVTGLEVASRECLLVEVERDAATALVDAPDEPFPQGLILVPHGENDLSINPTPWQLAVPEIPLDSSPEQFSPDWCDDE